MSGFTVGDKVVSYSPQCKYIGIIDKVHSDGILEIRDLDDDTVYFRHPKQCRKLVKKKRREFWIAISKEDSSVTLVYERKEKPNISEKEFCLVHVREVKE